MKEIDRIVADLKSDDGGSIRLNGEQEDVLRLALANYAMAAIMDTAIAQEAIEICESN
jgi:hypothetical protein